jgi:hypothetical protein
MLPFCSMCFTYSQFRFTTVNILNWIIYVQLETAQWRTNRDYSNGAMNYFFMSALAMRILIANSNTRRAESSMGSHRMGDGNFLKTAPVSLIKTYRMNLFSARSISLDSTFKHNFILCLPLSLGKAHCLLALWAEITTKSIKYRFHCLVSLEELRS